MARKMRLAVGGPSELHSGVWTFWTQGDEFYAAELNARGTMKLSVHSSGICRYALTETAASQGANMERESDPRVMARWTIAPIGETDWTLCLSLAVPTIFIPRRFDQTAIRPSRRASIVWIPAAPMMHGRFVTVYRARTAEQNVADVVSEDPAIGDYEVLGCLSLKSGGVVWVITYTILVEAKALQFWQREVAAFRLQYDKELPKNPLATMTSPDDQRSDYPVLREVSLGWSNIDVSP